MYISFRDPRTTFGARHVSLAFMLVVVCAQEEQLEPSETRPPPPSFRRLVSVARGEVFWIACGLIALLCRMPFTLAVPHYVSVALAAALSGDRAEAAVRHSDSTSARSCVFLSAQFLVASSAHDTP